ncbi:MAG: hypothetical protein KKA64_03925 [Nanoarchaeota archaeon]|nr:hypothetical protein [Nanoarchaeota archaeon]
MAKGVNKKTRIIIIVLVILAIILLATRWVNNSTGKATLTNGASYDTISLENSKYTDCAYITEDDEWRVTESATVQATDTETGEVVSATDSCIDESRVLEYDCQSGKRNKRNVVCPSGTSCKEGICVVK